ncbi:hypothetical protein BFG52_02030 [Acinetobacter larvae]|uniref:LD-carboxypeptidase C-terminal domain-containing protein n=2 Tax=Acinetobacter larvae TaxID=1789224 RepID=A0A1B2LWC6_9GAMM|nr:hypothetical protein BFG52_02030 [Acinetobacter larvae]
MSPCQLLRCLMSLKLQGWFDELGAVLIGRSAAPLAATDQLTELEILERIFGDFMIPVLYDADIGHVPPQVSLVNGALAEISFDGRMAILRQRIGYDV